MAVSDPTGGFRDFAPAKINLFLHVLGKREDGYHELDSLVVFADVGDHLTAVPADAWGLDITGPFADDLKSLSSDDNLILNAARLAGKWAESKGLELPPLHLTLEKQLPVAAGIGGGSADAGAALRLCGRAAGFAANQKAQFAEAAALGADVPACLLSKPTWLSGVGEGLRPALVTSKYSLVLVNPGIAVPTADVFARLALGKHGAPRDERPNLLSLDELTSFLATTRNDLEGPACAMAPEIRTALDEIEQTSPLVARMSGSGATCFGIYESRDQADTAAQKIRAAQSDWWVMAADPVRG